MIPISIICISHIAIETVLTTYCGIIRIYNLLALYGFMFQSYGYFHFYYFRPLKPNPVLLFVDVCVRDHYREQSLGSILTNVSSQILQRKISVEFVFL